MWRFGVASGFYSLLLWWLKTNALGLGFDLSAVLGVAFELRLRQMPAFSLRSAKISLSCLEDIATASVQTRSKACFFHVFHDDRGHVDAISFHCGFGFLRRPHPFRHFSRIEVLSGNHIIGIILSTPDTIRPNFWRGRDGSCVSGPPEVVIGDTMISKDSGHTVSKPYLSGNDKTHYHV